MSEKYTISWQNSRISENSTIRDALSAISACGAMMACVVSEDGILSGILTDSDLRRALLSSASLTDLAKDWMNRNPVVAYSSHTLEDINKIVTSYGIREVPIVDSQGRLEDIFVLGTHDKKKSIGSAKSAPGDVPEIIESPCSMMILAGGLGTRLRPVVNDRPKPLALVGDKPVLETVILRAAAQGIRNFYISINYMGDQIEAHLNEPQYQGLNIKLIRETKRLGTAGSLSLIEDEISTPIIVANSDILTTASFPRMLRRHKSQNAFVTCAVRPYSYKVPFGVCDIQDSKIVKIIEKPEMSSLVNAGIYILDPRALKMIPTNSFYDMPDLLKACIDTNQTVTPFYLHEYWIDIGKPEDFYKANEDFKLHF